MTTTPSLTMSEAMVPLKVSPCCVVALSRVWVMRMGRVVPGLRVMLRKAGAGGGGGGGSCLGGGGGAAAVTAGAGACTVRLLTTVLTPGTCAASAAARERAASLLTVPLRVATCFWTED